MRTFLALAILTGAALWGALKTPRTPVQLQVLRICLFIAAAFFGVLLVVAMAEALIATA